jgi:hypothetical protein
MRSSKAGRVPLDDQKAVSFSAAATIETSSRLHADRPSYFVAKQIHVL